VIGPSWLKSLRRGRDSRLLEVGQSQVQAWFNAAGVALPAGEVGEYSSDVWAPEMSPADLAALWAAWPAAGGTLEQVSRLRLEVTFGPLRVNVASRVPRLEVAAAWARAIMASTPSRAGLSASELLYRGAPGDPIVLDPVAEVLATLIDDLIAPVIAGRQLVEAYELGWMWSVLEQWDTPPLVATARALSEPDSGRVVELPAAPGPGRTVRERE
jgi:hypothetical protein